MAQLLNGAEPFIHPVTKRLVGPFEWYEGYSHVAETEEKHDKKSIAALEKAEKEAAAEPTAEAIRKAETKKGKSK